MSKNTNLSFLTDYITADITNGRIGINNASPTVAFDVSGATKISGVLTLTSTISNGTYTYTLPSATGTLALTSALSGTTNYVSKFTSASAIGNSILYDNGTLIGINITSSGYTSPSLLVNNNSSVSIPLQAIADTTGGRLFRFYTSDFNNTTTGTSIRLNFGAATGNTSANLQVYTGGEQVVAGTTLALQPSGGNVGIGNSSPSGVLDVIGTNIFLGATSKIILSYDYGTSTNSNSPELAFYGQSFAASTSVYGPSIQAINQTTFARKDLVFYQHNAADFTNRYEAMRLTYGGSLLMAKDAAIGINTADGSDNGYLALCGAGGDGPNRGGHIYLSGNERPDDPGHVTISAGNVIGIGSVITFRTAGTERMRLIGNGRLLIGTSTDQGYLLYVNGNAAGTSGFANVSDKRLKKDITPIESALNKVKQLNGVSFNWDKTLRPDLNLDENNHLGLIAQDVEAILPQVVSTGEDEFETKTIIYSDIVPVLIEAIKEQQAQIEELKTLLKA
jgi:hypothetical protein